MGATCSIVLLRGASCLAWNMTDVEAQKWIVVFADEMAEGRHPSLWHTASLVQYGACLTVVGTHVREMQPPPIATVALSTPHGR